VEDKRLLVVLSAFTKGGAQKVLLNLTPEWLALGHKVRIVLIQDSKDELDLTLFHQLGVEIIRLRSRSAHDWKALFRAQKFIRDFSPDVIQCHLFLAQLWGAFFKIFNPRASLVWVEHNMYLDRSRFEWKVFRILSKWTHEVVAVSVEVMEYLAKQRIVGVRFIPNPISSDFFLRNLSNRDANIVFVGRFTDQKNPLLALKAFEYSLANGAIPSFSKLFMVGAGYLQEELMNYVTKNELSSKVEFTGFLNSEPLSNLFNECLILLSTSRHEGCPLVRSEAIASGCCIVTTQTGGLKGILTEDREGKLPFPGVFVVPDSALEISKSLGSAFSDEYWKQSSIKFRASVASSFNPKVIAKKYLEN
jgi:glycosyltransferase involved in cell wall biosynthesis